MGNAIDTPDLTKPKAAPPVTGGNVAPVAKKGGSFHGVLSNWAVGKLSRFSEGRERENITDRARDLYFSDPAAAAGIDGLVINTVGTGLTPQSRPSAELLGWAPEAARAYARSAEFAFGLWAAQGDARGRLATFGMQQLLVCYNLFIRGEFFRQPVMLDETGRIFSLALQPVDPMRVVTPAGSESDPLIRDGVKLGPRGNPLTYHVYNGRELLTRSGWTTADFIRVPAWVGHRRGMLHGFVQKEDEQVRGVSVLAPAMEAFRNLSDYFEYEVVAAIIAAAFPVWIETQNAMAAAGMPGAGAEGEKPDPVYHREFAPGGVYYGNENERPHPLKAERPAGNFEPFILTIKRTLAAAIGEPYEVFAKDFSQTNYSSARAALLEAARVYANYRMWLVGQFCRPVWEMVIEEAYLRDMLDVPAGSPDYYDMPWAYTHAAWVPPRRGHVDPVKEIQGMILAKDHNLLTLAQQIAELGGDWEETLNQREIETRTEAEKGITPRNNSDKPGLAKREETDEPA